VTIIPSLRRYSHFLQLFPDFFPRANIYELVSPDLLHQLIKGTFKDHLVEWVTNYISKRHPGVLGKAILADIDRRWVHSHINCTDKSYPCSSIGAAPPFGGLRRFPEGRGFKQWTGDDSKALMKVLFHSTLSSYSSTDLIQNFNRYIYPRLKDIYPIGCSEQFARF
jgi:hypothetical protein